MRARQLLRVIAVLVLLATSSGPFHFRAYAVSSRGANPGRPASTNDVAQPGDGESIQDTGTMTTRPAATISSWLISPESDLTYRGAFRLPDEEANGTSWSYGGHGMGYYPNGDPSGPANGYPGSLFSISHPYQNYVSEFSIPAPVISQDKDVADLPIATTLQSFADVTAGRQTGGLTGTTLGDIQYYPQQGDQTSDKLYWVMYEYYLPPFEGLGHGWCELDFTDLQSQGTWRLDDFPFSATSRYLFDIPERWADVHTAGKYLAAGRSRVVNGGSWGPALYAFGPWNDGNPPPDGSSLDAVELLSYDSGHTLANYSHSDDWSDGAWLTAGDKSAVIIGGMKALRTSASDLEYYGEPGVDGCGYKGYHAEPYYSLILFYDPAMLAEVARGTILPHEVQPYATLNLEDHMFVQGCRRTILGGVAYDRQHGILYVMEQGVDGYYARKPIVHVFGMTDQRQGPDLIAPTVPGNLQIDGATSEQIDFSWDASSDNVHLVGYIVYRDGVPIATTVQTSYSDDKVNPSVAYSYTVAAWDARDNHSDQSAPLMATASAGEDSRVPIMSDVKVTGITDSSATISWRTDELATTVVRYEIQYSEDETTFEDDTLTTTHQVVLTGLAGGENYSYHIASTDAAGNEYEHPGKQFRTSPPGGSENASPVLNGIGSRRVYEGEQLWFTIRADDDDREPLTYAASGVPPGASFDTEIREFSWTPGFDDAGTYRVTFTASDGDQSDSERVTIFVWDNPTLVLHSAAADRAIHLSWTVNTTLPVTSTWRIAYDGPTGDQPSPITDIISSTRAYTLTGLTNYTWYTITLNAVLGTASLLADTVRAMPSDRILYLPSVLRASPQFSTSEQPSTGAVAPLAPDMQAAEEAIAVIRQDCGSYGGTYNCYTSLAAWQADFGGIDFGSHTQGDLIAADRVAVARIEGPWTGPDVEPLNISGWNTDATHYVRIYTTSEARHDGTPGSGYRLEISDPSSRPIYSNVAYLRIAGLEIHSNSSYAGSLVYLRPDSDEGAGEIHLSHNLVHGNGTNSSSGIHNYSCRGTIKIWNNVIYDVGDPGYTAGIQTGAGTAYVYNNTIVDIISGFAIRTGGQVVAKNNLTEAPGDDFYGSFYLGSDFNASADDTAPGFNSRRDQTFAFVDRANQDFHLAAVDEGARNHGMDLSNDPHLAIADDVDAQIRSGGWDIGADEEPSAPDAVPPTRLNGSPEGTLPSDTTAAILSLTTNESAACRYATTPETSYPDMTAALSVTNDISHTHTVTGLQDERTYTYYVKCQDTSGNANTDDYEISFYVASSDVTPPIVSDVRVIGITPYSADITWATDEGCTSQVEHGRTAAYGQMTVVSPTRVLSHSISLVGLDPATTYHFRVRSQDVAYNETMSGHYTFTTGVLSQFYYVDQGHPQASDDTPGTEDLPWETIQHATDVAQPGDTIIVFPGNYGRVKIREGGTMSRTVTYKGVSVPDQSLVDPDALFDPGDPVQVAANPTLNAVTRGFELVPTYGSGVTIGYVRIENFEITDIHGGETPSGQGGIRLQDTERVEIVRNFFHDLNPDPASYGYIGIRGSTHDNVGVVIKENTLYRVQGTGISITGRNWIVEGNELSHGLDANTDTGAHVGGDSDALRFFGSGHVIRNNHMHDYLDIEQYGDPHIDCFQTFSVYPESQFAHDILIEGNTCDNFGQMLMIEDSSEAEGTGNKVHHITFRNNVFRGARANAINGSRADHFTFVNNVVAESHYSAIGLINTPYRTFLNNVFYNNGSGSQIGDQASKVGSVWDYNVHYPDFSWPPKQPEFDQHSLFGDDPRFVNPDGGDFHLLVDSPAIDRGTGLVTFNYDKDAVGRPQGAAWDIGAFEARPELALRAIPGSGALHLRWVVNVTLPATSTWLIDYRSRSGTLHTPIAGITTTARAYTLTGLTNHVWYTVTLNAMAGGAPLLADTIQAMPMGHFLYLPSILKAP